MAVAMTASQAQEPGPGTAAARKTVGSLNPATGQPIATFPVYQREDADVAVSRAREAARWSGGLGWRERRARLLDWKSYLTGHMDELARLMHEETGKPADDATLEIILAIVHVDWAARHARRVLGPHRVFSGMTAINSVIAFAMVPALPFGGVGESGFGRIHGADGLREFTRAKAITSQWMKPPINLTSFGRTDADLRRTIGLIRLLHGRRGRSAESDLGWAAPAAPGRGGDGCRLLPGGAAPGQLLPTGSAPEWVR